MKLMTKILDNYYTEKLKKEISRCRLGYFIDTRFVNTEYGFQFQIKKEEYNEKQYKVVATFYKEDSFYNMCILDKIREIIDDRIRTYLKEGN